MQDSLGERTQEGVNAGDFQGSLDSTADMPTGVFLL